MPIFLAKFLHYIEGLGSSFKIPFLHTWVTTTSPLHPALAEKLMKHGVTDVRQGYDHTTIYDLMIHCCKVLTGVVLPIIVFQM